MLSRNVEVRLTVRVTVDETKFTPKFIEEYRQSFFNFFEINDHIKHLARLYAVGICDATDFIEGYGPASKMGIKFEEVGEGIDEPYEDEPTLRTSGATDQIEGAL